MIKVNLLTDQTSRTRKKSFVTPTVSSTGLIFLALFLLAAGGISGWYFYVKHEINKCREKQKILRAEEARLKGLKQEIEKFEKLKQQRLSRIEVIEQLKENQKGPVLLLNSVIQSIPRNGLLWLSNLTQKDDRVRIVGNTKNTEVIPDFMINLAASGIFQSVDLEMIDNQKDAAKFSLICITANRKKAE